MSGVRQNQMLIDGEWAAASDGAIFDSIDPTSGEFWCRVPLLTWRSSRTGRDDLTRGKRK